MKLLDLGFSLKFIAFILNLNKVTPLEKEY